PNRIALIGTPFGFSHSGEITGHCDAGAVNRLFGWAASCPVEGSQGLPCQSNIPAAGRSSWPSHQTVPSGLRATLVKTALRLIVALAFGLVFAPVPGPPPKKPASGFTAQSRPSSPMRSHAMSSPIVHPFHPWAANGPGGTSIAMFDLPQAEGNAAVT